MVAFPILNEEVTMGLMDLMMAGSAMAEGIVALHAGTWLWLLLVGGLFGSGLGIVSSSYQPRAFDLSVLRQPRTPRLSAAPNQLLEAGSV
jgi:hypothetical protein